MKRLKFLMLLFGMIALHCTSALAGQITHTVTYDPAKLSIRYDTINGTTYALMDYEGLNSLFHVAQPDIPYDIFTFSVPYNANNFSAQCQIYSYTEIEISSPVVPCQSPHAICDTTSVLFTMPDTTIYQLNDFYPSNPCRISEPFFLSGSGSGSWNGH